MQKYQISVRLTFSTSLLREEHLHDCKCNELCALLEKNNEPQNGVIIHSFRSAFGLSAKELSGSLSDLIREWELDSMKSQRQYKVFRYFFG